MAEGRLRGKGRWMISRSSINQSFTQIDLGNIMKDKAGLPIFEDEYPVCIRIIQRDITRRVRT
jgi:hypothetical protein